NITTSELDETTRRSAMALQAAISAAFREYCDGVQSAISLHRILPFYINSRLICVSSAKVLQREYEAVSDLIHRPDASRLCACFVLNGLIFLGSIFFFDRVVIPVIHLFGEILHHSLAYETSQAESVRDRIDGFVFFLYQALWMYPIYCISFILNTIWYQEIADDGTFLQLHGKPSPVPVADMIRDELYRAILVAFFLTQTVLSYLFPIAGPACSFIHLSWLYSLYCYEYKWSLAGWSLERRLTHLERNWAYFAGFGSPFTLATFFVPNFVSKGIFALLFPVFLLQAIVCDPTAASTRAADQRLPMFRQSLACEDTTAMALTSSRCSFSRWWTLLLLRRVGKATGLQTKKQHHATTDVSSEAQMPVATMRIDEAYTVSKMLSSMNDVMAPMLPDSKATIALKRKLDNGIMLDTSPKEIAYLDTRAKIKHSAMQTAALNRNERSEWMNAKREQGNEAFRRGEYAQAADIYIEALAGIEFGKSESEKREVKMQVQLPLTCNLVSCMLMMKQWYKAKQMADMALAIDVNNVRARQQRAKALTKLYRYDEARADVNHAIDAIAKESKEDDEAVREKLVTQLKDIDTAQTREAALQRRQIAFERKMMREAAGTLYRDKKAPVVSPAVNSVMTVEKSDSRWHWLWVALAVVCQWLLRARAMMTKKPFAKSE
ncbi:TPA: LOW QUALITY PROTEIN: hypothetical protein N0F65_005912, partial [Lagenidium giganteum]